MWRMVDRMRDSRGFKWMRTRFPQRLVNLTIHLPVAILANLFYGFPGRKLNVVGITGTKGKTTTAHLLYHILHESGRKTALISTLGAKIGAAHIDTGLHVTNPAPPALQRLLKRALQSGSQIAILELTSHGLDQYRDWGIPFALALFTHVRNDHLRYHGGREGYRRAKAKLIKQARMALFNSLDPSLPFLRSVARQDGVRYAIYRPKRDDFDVQNREAAIAGAVKMGVKRSQAAQALKSFPGIKGRMEAVYAGDFTVIVDFAHTPESLEAALNSLRSRIGKDGRLIAVFGCAGGRDPGRRKMGAVAARLADIFIITAEDPRTESVEEISHEIAAHARGSGANEVDPGELANQRRTLEARSTFTRIPDRRAAIAAAIHLAQSGDVIGLFGKGHEQSMCYGHVEYPWSEHEAVRQALKGEARI